MKQTKVTGMVISTMPVGDYDNRLVLLTREKGKITAFARGARRQNSNMMAGSRLFSFGEFMVYPGRDSFTITGMKIKEYFENLSKNLDLIAYSTYFLEIANYFGRENIDAKDMLNLLYVTLKTMQKDIVPLSLIRSIFELKMLVINGEYPETFFCKKCGKPDNIIAFSKRNEGMICKECLGTVGDARVINSSTLYTLQFIVSTPLNHVYSFTLSDEVLVEVNEIIQNYFSNHTDKAFKSLTLIGK